MEQRRGSYFDCRPRPGQADNGDRHEKGGDNPSRLPSMGRRRSDMLLCFRASAEQSRDATKLSAWRETAANQKAALTPRQRQVMELVLAGQPSKIIAADLGISQRTVENHRAAIMKKTGSKSLPALAHLALSAAWNSPDERSFKKDPPSRPTAN